ncbi:hypothetical protein FRC08_003226 [Ceratobasidium sp. 394]|nr:hypothetical protein FRC08_003226 [Ceratobasidium sp. 394]
MSVGTHSRLHPPDELLELEKKWVSFQPYLLSRGYELRPRYRPGWVPSWKLTGANPRSCEDSINSMPVKVLDATRLEDQLQVAIKILRPSKDDREGAEELEILQRFSAPPFNDDPTNHTIPYLDSFPIPNEPGCTFVVMPLLTTYDQLEFYNLLEIQDFLTQIFEGLRFLHRHDVAHCDIASPNIMMDSRPLYNEPFHPFLQNRSRDGTRYIRPQYLRVQKPVRYYYIDFGFATWFRDPAAPRLVVGTDARERAPEQIAGGPYDPFKGDVYQLGAVVLRDLIPRYESLGFLLPLIREMTNKDPNRRPSIHSACSTMKTCFAGLPGWRNRWPLTPPNISFKRHCFYILIGLRTEFLVFLKRLIRFILLRG